jgi:small-conductance mechanosensitive channel
MFYISLMVFEFCFQLNFCFVCNFISFRQLIKRKKLKTTKNCKWIFTFPENIIGIMLLSFLFVKIFVKSLHQVFMKRIVKNVLSRIGKNTFLFFIWLIALVLISARYVFDILTLFIAD